MDWIAELQAKKTGTFEIPRGVYDVSNIRIAKATDLIIHGNGSLLRFDPFGSTPGFILRDCKNVRIDGLRFHSPNSYARCRVLKVGKSDITVVSENGVSPTAEGRTKVVNYTRAGYLRPFMHLYVSAVEKLTTQNEYRISISKPSKATMPSVGDIVFAANRNGATAVMCNFCADCEFRDTVVHSSGNMGFIEYYCSNMRYESCHIRPIDSEWFSTNADGFHSRGSIVAPTYVSCSVRGAGDDALNVHGEMFAVVAPDLILYSPPSTPKSGMVYHGNGSSSNMELYDIVGDSVEPYIKELGLVKTLGSRLILQRVKITPEIPKGTFIWQSAPQGGGLFDFRAKNCWSTCIKWRSNDFHMEHVSTQRGGSEMITVAQPEWLEGPGSVGGQMLYVSMGK